MQKRKAIKIGMLGVLMLVGSLASVMYALAYSEKRELIYSNTITIEGREVKYRDFYLSAPAIMFEVKLIVSEGTIKWTPYSTVLFEATPDSFQGWECETNNGIVKWRIDPENLDQDWYLTFLNEDSYEKEVTVEVTKVWSEQNYQDWM